MHIKECLNFITLLHIYESLIDETRFKIRVKFDTKIQIRPPDPQPVYKDYMTSDQV